MDSARQAAHLQTIIGQRLTAYGVGVQTPKIVGQWADGAPILTIGAATRLHDLHKIVTILEKQYDPETIRAWLMGMNSDMQDRAPIEVVREGEGVEAIYAAAAFLD